MSIYTDPTVICGHRKLLERCGAVTLEFSTESATVTIKENETAVGTYAYSSYTGSGTVSYSLSGDDSGHFSIDAASGALAFATAPDYETPLDTGADNTYDIVIAVTDGSLSDTMSLAIAVANLAETSGGVDTLELSFATVTSTDIRLPNGNVNAKEVYQLAHYIARTEPEEDEADIDIPIRCYSAACATDTDAPRMFVSVTLEDSIDSDITYGSVYELQYNPETAAFEPTGNETLLTQCYESHGVAVSSDCSRVAVLCNAKYGAADSYTVTKDIVAETGSDWMNKEDNHSQIDDRIAHDLALMLVTNYSTYMDFFVNHPTITIDDYLEGLAAEFPNTSYDYSSFTKFKRSGYEKFMSYILDQLSDTDLADLHQHVRDKGYQENDSIWQPFEGSTIRHTFLTA